MKQELYKYLKLFSFLSAVLLAASISSCTGEQGTPVVPAKDETGISDLRGILKTPPETVLLSFEDVDVTKAELRDAFLALFNKPTAEDTRKKAQGRVMEAVLFRNYLYREALGRGLSTDPEIQAGWEARIPLWTGKFYARTLDEKVTIDEAVARAVVPSTSQVIRVRQVVLEDLDQAQIVRKRALDGEDFSELARTFSTGPAAEKGGMLSDPIITGVASHYGEDVTRRLGYLEEGDISTVIQTGLGYTIFRVDEKRNLSKDEIQAMVDDRILKLKLDAAGIMKMKILENNPLEFVPGALEKAIKTGDEDTVIANVGDYPVTWGWMKKVVIHLWFQGKEAASSTSVSDWEKRVKEVAPDLALLGEAISEGFLEKNVTYRENIQRARKDALVRTAYAEMRKNAEPSDEEVFAYYMESAVGEGSEEGVYSLEGARGLESEAAAKSVYEKLAAPNYKKNLGSLLEPGSAGERLSGTYRESMMEKDEVATIERTPAGTVTAPFESEGKWSIYRVLAKRRGEMPPFDSEFGRMKKSAWEKRIAEDKGNVVARGLASAPPEFRVDKSLVYEMIGEWLDARKTLKGISPSTGTYH